MARQRNAEVVDIVDEGLGNKELPAYKHKQEILANIETYKAIILGGATGSGKSTQLPQYLYEAGYDMTIMLVPRRVIADGLGERIREELSDQIEGFDAQETVGIIHGERSERHDNNKITVMTPNTFIKMERDLRKKYANKKLAIVADEIHEANLFTEIATGAAAMSVKDHESWRLIAASATHNADTLQEPFQKLNNGGYVPEIMIEGRPFNVELQEESTLNPMQVYAQKSKGHEKTMIFTSGKREIDHIIEETVYELEKNEPGSSSEVVFRKLHGELSEYELAHIDDPIPADSRLVIVSSPAGMSGITIPGVTLVISDGTINREELDEDGVPGLARHYLAKSEVIQQIGRAGRDVPGGIGIIAKPTTIMDDILRQKGETVEVPQMDFIEFTDREEHAPPEIYSTNLSRVVLSTARLGHRFSNLNDYIPHRVKSSEIIKAEEALYRLGALNDEGNITPVGKFMDDFPISPELSRGLFEVRKRGGTLQQLARASFVAAALNEGGLQDFTEKDKIEWKQLLRTSTDNDYIAQLDIMTELEYSMITNVPMHEFVEKYDLSAKRVERARKSARKMLQVFKMNIENIIITPPAVNEERELLNDFAAGLIDNTYRESGTINRKKTYQNIHGDRESKRRNLSSRSVTIPRKGELLAGMPRWYKTWNKKDSKYEKFDIVELTMSVDPAIIAKYAIENRLLTGKLVDPQIDGDSVIEREQKMFGSLAVGTPVTMATREFISPQAQDLLVEKVLKAPGDAQLALRDIAEELERYHEQIPAEVIKRLKKADAPEEITKDFIKTLIVNAAKRTRYGHQIDLKLRSYLYSQNIGIDQYFDEDALEELRQLSPKTTIVGGEVTRILYDKGEPYVTGLLKRQRIRLDGPIFLEDGREVKLQVPVDGGGTERISIPSKTK